ncbi:MAG: ABC-2 family transporter protein [Bacilli bacterium]|nr:ABC-2 family transporter protein [Bacilli bacterium]
MLMEVKNNVRVSLLSIKYNIMREMVNTVSFILKVFMMMLNNSTFIIQWLVLFSLKDNFGGFVFKDVMLLWGISAASFGMSHLFFGGIGLLPSYIEEGKLDAYLVQPKSVLLMTSTSASEISALGDLLYGIIVALIFWHRPLDIVLFIFFTILSCIIYTAFRIILSSITFWFLRAGDAAESIRSIYINFSLYPQNIFSRAIKFIMFTIIPAGISIYLPVKTIINFDTKNTLIVIFFTIFIVITSVFIFNKGIKKYESANLMSARV